MKIAISCAKDTKRLSRTLPFSFSILKGLTFLVEAKIIGCSFLLFLACGQLEAYELFLLLCSLQVISLHNAAQKFASLIPFIVSKDDVQNLEVDWKNKTIDVCVASKLRIFAGKESYPATRCFTFFNYHQELI